MDTSLFFGGSAIAAVIAGMIALFAPCCISVMLPAYFASSFQNRRLLVAMTMIFAGGIATVILPIALGASFIQQVLIRQHTIVYVGGGIIMLGLTVYLAFGGEIHLPMPGRRAGKPVGPLSVYTLGIFSGMASACCAPVLAGVIALSSVAASFGAALGLGLAYVFGMVMPLFVISLLWERLDWRGHRLFAPRTFTWRLGTMQRTLSGSTLASVLLLSVISGMMIWAGLTLQSMPPLRGWQANLVVVLQHIGTVLTQTFAWMPGWLDVLLIVALGAFFARRTWQQLTPKPPHIEGIHDDTPTSAIPKEEVHV